MGHIEHWYTESPQAFLAFSRSSSSASAAAAAAKASRSTIIISSSLYAPPEFTPGPPTTMKTSTFCVKSCSLLLKVRIFSLNGGAVLDPKAELNSYASMARRMQLIQSLPSGTT